MAWDKNKSKAELIGDLKSLRRRIAKFEKGSRIQSEADREKARLEHFLQERIKELTCLYGVADLIERHGSSPDKILQGIADLLPGSWQYPEIACGRVILDARKYVSVDFGTSRWKQTAVIKVGGSKVGAVEVYYLAEKPTLDEGPFLQEERLLIDAVAERIGRAVQRIGTEQELETERAALNNMNVALREVLRKVEDEKQEIGARIQANVDKVIMPILYALENGVRPGEKAYVALLRKNLEDMISPFTSKLSKAFMSLTPVEIQTCSMIKNGLSTKEIAGLRHVSPVTVNRHREHIRRKLGITNKDVNLATYLQTFMSEAAR